MKRAVAGACLAIGGSAAGLLWTGVGQGIAMEPDPRQLERGREIYAANCASCHGKKLEGERNWRRRLSSGRLPAPPHDASGHTWHHPDQVLFRITKDGTAAVVGGGYESDMPGFGGVLSDDEIRAVLDFIKSTWPERQRRTQSDISRRAKEANR